VEEKKEENLAAKPLIPIRSEWIAKLASLTARVGDLAIPSEQLLFSE